MKTLKTISGKMKKGGTMLPLIIALFFMASCTKDDNVKPSVNSSLKQQSAVRLSNDVDVPQAIVFPIIKIEHRGGKTSLPAYTVAVTSDGYLTYNGINNVYTKGIVISKLRADIFESVKNLFTQFNFYQIRDTLELVPDVPVNITCYQESLKIRSKILLDDGDRYPFILIQLRQKVENLLHISNYVKGNSFPVLIPVSEDKVL